MPNRKQVDKDIDKDDLIALWITLKPIIIKALSVIVSVLLLLIRVLKWLWQPIATFVQRKTRTKAEQQTAMLFINGSCTKALLQYQCGSH